MTILGLIISIVLPSATVYLVLTTVWPRPLISSNAWNTILRTSFAAILGPALCASAYFVWLVVFGKSSSWYIVAESAAMLLVAWLSIRRLRRNPKSQGGSRKLGDSNNLTRVVMWIGVAIFVMASLNLILLSWNAPHGQWDAWSIWNLRARFIDRGGVHWQDGHSNLIAWSHPDYPLLLPCMVARCWLFMGRESVLAPIVVSSLAMLATATLAASVTAILRGSVQGMLAALAILGADYYVRHAAYQYADTLLSFWFTAALALLVLAHTTILSQRTGYALCGLVCALAAWTKNEGAIFAVIFGIVVLIISCFKQCMVPVISRRESGLGTIPSSTHLQITNRFLWFILGAATIACLWIYFKLRIAPANDLVQSLNLAQTWIRFCDPTRYQQVAAYFAQNIITYGGGLPVVLFLFWLLMGRTKQRIEGVRGAMVILLLVLAAYFFVYILTPQNLLWHLQTSARRLFLQLHPAAVMVFFLMVKSPLELLQDPTDSPIVDDRNELSSR